MFFTAGFAISAFNASLPTAPVAPSITMEFNALFCCLFWLIYPNLIKYKL
jgi:hypothetical protein